MANKTLENFTKAQLIEELNRLQRRVDACAAAERVAAGAPPSNTEEAWRKAETLYKKAEQLAGIGDWEWDEVAMRCTLCSEGLARLFGTTVEHYMATTSSRETELDWVHPADRERWLQNDTSFRAHGTPYDIEYRHVTTDGRSIDVREVAEAVFDEEGRVVKSVGYVQDISDRKRIERALKDSEQRFRDFAATASDWYWETDANHRLTFVSEGFETSTGLPRDIALGKTHMETLRADPGDDRWKGLVKDLGARRPFRGYQYDVTGDDHGPYHITISGMPFYDSDGAFSGYRGTGRDITEQRRAEEALRTSEAEAASARAQLIEAIETLSEGFVWFDKDDRLVLCNSKYREMYDRSADLVVPGARFEDMIREGARRGQVADSAGRIEAWVQERLDRHRNPAGPFHQRLGNNRWLQVSERRLPDGGIVGIRTDITWPKDMEEELRRNERLATLGQLTATVSHELRNPLGTMRSSISAMKKLTADSGDDFLKRAVALTDRSITRCDTIITDLLDYARVAELAPEATKVDNWLETVVAEFDPPEGLEVRLALDGNLEIALDRDRMRRVIVNLLENACHAMMDERREKLTDGGHRLTVATAVVGGRLIIRVTDTGCGVASGDLPKVFEPLFSTKSFGVGVGLPLVKRIVEQHAGTVTIESEPGDGTTVELDLPAEGPDRAAHRQGRG